MGKVKIKPTVDCVFKAILGKVENKSLLIHFLNAVLDLHGDESILDVTITNPYNEKDYIDSKLSIVDIKTKDDKGHYNQIDVQIVINAWLSSRILHYWASIYHSQLESGQDYSELKPATSIWLLEDYLFKPEGVNQNPDDFLHLNFQIFERNLQFSFSDHLDIHLLQLPFLQENTEIKTDKDKWLYFFKEGHNLDIKKLPKFLKTEEFIKAMETLTHFSHDQRAYLLYQERINAIREQATWQNALQRKDAQIFQFQNIVKDKDVQIQQRDAQIDQLKALLMEHQITIEDGQ